MPPKRNFTFAQVNNQDIIDGMRASSLALAQHNGVKVEDFLPMFIYGPENVKMRDGNELKKLEGLSKRSRDAVELHAQYSVAHVESRDFLLRHAHLNPTDTAFVQHFMNCVESSVNHDLMINMLMFIKVWYYAKFYPDADVRCQELMQRNILEVEPMIKMYKRFAEKEKERHSGYKTGKTNILFFYCFIR